MKQYLLLLKSSDFKKYYPQNLIPSYATNVSSELTSNFYSIGPGRSSDSEILDLFTSTSANNVWVSEAFNLYTNSQYSNYSYTRSRYGLNLIGDRTYVGTEVTSPSYDEHSTPYADNVVYKTEVGEIVRDSATPSILRFIDTTSRLDILSFKYSFTNLLGAVVPTLAVTVFESDSEDGPWLRSSVSGDTGIIFIRNAKPFVKLVIEVSGEEIDYFTTGLIFYLEIGIHDPNSKVLSDSARNILKRFPSWTALFEDSVADATPSLAVPESTGGKFINSLVQENLDNFSADVDIYDINAFIGSANEEMLDWIFIAYNVPQNINLIFGDSVELTRVSTLKDLLDGFETDYSFFYNPLEKQLVSLRKFNNLLINNSLYEQESINVFNDFDEFGARVGLPRLYLENNSNYKKRILDVTKNLSGISIDAFKRTVRREMDLWRVYGSTPNSDFIGATPDVLEISDIENDPNYFSADGSPLPKFRSLVSELNYRYPSNFGYIKWGDAHWDYAGLRGEGINRIPAIYDVATPLGDYFQPGVGDFDDALITFRPLDSSTVSFSGSIDIAGYKAVSESDIYTPIIVDYDAYFTYTRTVSDSEANEVGAGFVYEVFLPAHGEYASPTAFYSNINYTSNPDLYVTNNFTSTSSSSPEFRLINIFDQDGFSDPEIEFRNKVYGEIYENDSVQSINIYDAASVNLVLHKSWSHVTQTYSDIAVGDYKARFSYSNSPIISGATPGTIISLSTPNMNNISANVSIGSNLYYTKPELYRSNTYSNRININNINDMSIAGATPDRIYLSNIKNSDIIPTGATPGQIFINPRNLQDYTLFREEFFTEAIGGVTYNPYEDAEYLVPSSPNIIYTKHLADASQVDSVDFFESATVNYSSSINYIEISSSDGQYYPLIKTNYEYFSATSTPNLILGFIDENGNVYKDENEYNNTYTIGDRYLDSISLNKDTFNLDHSSKYIVDYLRFNATPSTVDIYVENSETLISNFNSAIVNNSSIVEAVYAINDEVRTDQFGLGIHTGYIYFNNSDQYIYSNPITENYNGQFFEILLSKVPRKAAPIIVKVGDEEYRNIVFEDSATPGKPSFWNTETVLGTYNNNLYLAYENVKNLSITDTFSGRVIFDNLQSTVNYVQPFNAATPSVIDREYEVTYYVNNAFYVDKDYYDEETDSYQSILYLSSTPSSATPYFITYESSQYDDHMNIDLSMNQIEVPISEGFVYISKENFEFDYVELYLSPNYISDSSEDLLYLSIISYDINGNVKPYQTFEISCSELAVDNLISSFDSGSLNYITTNQYGYARAILKYSGSVPAELKNSAITLNGVLSGESYSHPNSQTDNYSKEIEFEILRSIEFKLELKATTSRLVVDADGVTRIGITGKILWNNKPFKHSLELGWAKARTLYSLFESAELTSFYSDSEGNFVLNEIVTQDNSDPDQWFARIETLTLVSEISQMLIDDGEVIPPFGITIVGDIVYWNERYDNIHYSNEPIPMMSPGSFIKEDNSDIIATPRFIYSHFNSSDIINTNSTPNWIPPQWVPLRRIDQYQIGLLGSTPNIISVYDNIHPDSGEE